MPVYNIILLHINYYYTCITTSYMTGSDHELKEIFIV